MPVEMSDLMQLALGQRPHLFMGELPRPVATYLRCSPGLVYLGTREFHKIANKHPEIRREEFQSLPHFIRWGRYYSDARRSNCLTLFAYGLENRQLYLCGLKAAENGGEVWIQTLHRTVEKKAERKMRQPSELIYGPK